MPEFIEVADRVWVLRVQDHDVNVVAIGGERGFVIVDTLASASQASEAVASLRRLGPEPVVAIINTHDHFDHVLGNATFAAEGVEVPIYATEDAAAATDPAAPPASHTFSSAAFVDLGDRLVELVHPGRGHTAGDLVVRVPEVDVLLAGDLIESSAPPSLGPDSWPLEWATTLDLVLGLLSPASVVIPGHGAVVDRAFVEDQCDDLRAIAEKIRELVSNGVPEAEAPMATPWPYPAEHLREAIARGYAQLPPAR
ncbi:MAG: MBL fold metallo-hydrolase, partial [Nocardioidaceae bacterium]|nr:MBL fold metallo-hydrolase [Nocardioidaceae bacterium]